MVTGTGEGFMGAILELAPARFLAPADSDDSRLRDVPGQIICRAGSGRTDDAVAPFGAERCRLPRPI